MRRIDFGARSYNASIGRFDRVDPLADVSRRFSPYAYVYNNPLIFKAPDGMFGDLYDQKGNKIGTDNKVDGRVYVVTDKQTVKDIKKSDGVVADASTVNSAVELPSAFIRNEMGKSVERSNNANNKRTDEFKGDDSFNHEINYKGSFEITKIDELTEEDYISIFDKYRNGFIKK